MILKHLVRPVWCSKTDNNIFLLPNLTRFEGATTTLQSRCVQCVQSLTLFSCHSGSGGSTGFTVYPEFLLFGAAKQVMGTTVCVSSGCFWWGSAWSAAWVSCSSILALCFGIKVTNFTRFASNLNTREEKNFTRFVKPSLIEFWKFCRLKYFSVVVLLRSCQIRNDQSDKSITTPLLTHLNQGNAIWADHCLSVFFFLIKHFQWNH